MADTPAPTPTILDSLARCTPVTFWSDSPASGLNGRWWCAVCGQIAPPGADKRDEAWHPSSCAWVRARGLRAGVSPQPEITRRNRMVYVAGPITGDPFGCVRTACSALTELRAEGLVPFLPQLSVLAEMVEHRSYDEWLAYDFDVIRHCAAVIRLPGESPGADKEGEFARSLGLPVFELPDAWPELRAWALLADGATPPETHPETQRVWVDGAIIDAVVIHREWAGYQRAAMRKAEAEELADGATPAGPACICPKFSDIGGYRIADLCCPVHGVDGSDPGDGPWVGATPAEDDQP